MERYEDRGGDSGIEAYELGDDHIVIKFSDTAHPYCYSYRTAGVEAVEAMKRLAIQGEGLNTFVNIHRPDFEK